MKLVKNSIQIALNSDIVPIYYGSINHYLANKRTIEKFAKRIVEASTTPEKKFEIDSTTESHNDSTDFYFSFIPLKGLEYERQVDLNKDKILKKLFIVDMLIKGIADKYIIRKGGYEADVSFFIQNENTPFENWLSYKQINLKYFHNELYIAFGSYQSLISEKQLSEYSQIDSDSISYILIDERYLVNKKFINDDLKNYRFLATNSIKIENKLTLTPKPLNYREYFKNINDVLKLLLEIQFEGITLSSSGFEELQQKYFFQVERNYSVMLFKDSHTNVNASNGMKFSGPLFVPEDVTEETEFLFIYSSPDKANELFRYLRDGLSFFPGLERYVGIPVRTPNKDLSLRYDNYNELPHRLEKHLEQNSEQLKLKKYVAIVIIPKGKTDIEFFVDEPEDNDKIYYRIKELLLQKNIPSQFIVESNIGIKSFHFFLPNIAIALLAKLGGIPWRLNKDVTNDLIIGFGEKKVNENMYLGNTVFFDNTGNIKENYYFNADNPSQLANNIISSLLNYKKQINEIPKRIIIHYYKAPNQKEFKEISKAIKELNFDIPFVFVEINDSKAKDLIAFDLTNEYSMPISGTCWEIRKGQEYILFNNTRYGNDAGKYKDEYPVKIKLYFSKMINPTTEIINETLAQVYEFSRIYWKSLRQQCKPVTIIYSDLVAKYAANFKDNKVPDSDIAKKIPWYL
uniref:Protein argonaute n=1 Tax=Ignavibacterium album TaxID=591197 RepID=A0A7V2ZJ72_9BACT